MGGRPAQHHPADPVRARRALVARWALIAKRIGSLAFALAIAVFMVAFTLGFNRALVTVVTACLAAGSILLAPAIVLGYAVKAAEREDQARGL